VTIRDIDEDLRLARSWMAFPLWPQKIIAMRARPGANSLPQHSGWPTASGEVRACNSIQKGERAWKMGLASEALIERHIYMGSYP
jgi:hypothetical protein